MVMTALHKNSLATMIVERPQQTVAETVNIWFLIVFQRPDERGWRVGAFRFSWNRGATPTFRLARLLCGKLRTLFPEAPDLCGYRDALQVPFDIIDELLATRREVAKALAPVGEINFHPDQVQAAG